jgi:peroxiredoxin
MWKLLLVLVVSLVASAQEIHPMLALGSAAPDFSLPGVDGETYSLSAYASSPILVAAFTCNHCPTAQMYEQRIQQLAADYKKRGVAVVAMNYRERVC